MTGGTMHLAAIGIEDLFLTNSPQVTFFKIVYRRHTNFSIEEIKQNFIQYADFGTKVTAPLSRNGDLIEKITLVINLPKINSFTDGISKVAWVKDIGYRIIKSISIEINGRTISRHYGEWMYLYNEIFNSQDTKYKKIIGNIPELINFTDGKKAHTLYVPLQFWFNLNSGNALPIIALLYSDVKINLELNSLDSCLKVSPTHYIKCDADIVNFIENEYIYQNINNIIYSGIYNSYDINNRYLYYYLVSKDNYNSIPYGTVNITPYTIYGQTSKFEVKPYTQQSTTKIITPQTYQYNKLTNVHLGEIYLLINYVYLDDTERLKFSQTKHDYLIEQIYYTENNEITGPIESIQLNVDNPAVFGIWVVQQQYLYNSLDYDNYTNGFNSANINSTSLITESTILLNDKERISNRNENYYNLIQPYFNNLNSLPKGVNMYSFSINPISSQPAGSCNMSKMETIKLKIKTDPILSTYNLGTLRAYFMCYNILRIANGFGGVIFEK
jgi:hypothetical protein